MTNERVCCFCVGGRDYEPGTRLHEGGQRMAWRQENARAEQGLMSNRRVRTRLLGRLHIVSVIEWVHKWCLVISGQMLPPVLTMVSFGGRSKMYPWLPDGHWKNAEEATSVATGPSIFSCSSSSGRSTEASGLDGALIAWEAG